MRRLWARVVAKLEDTHKRRTVMANAKANAKGGVRIAGVITGFLWCRRSRSRLRAHRRTLTDDATQDSMNTT